jgi:hypothetical protein
MFRVRTPACLATAIRRGTSRGETFASQDRLPQHAPRTCHPDASSDSARNAAHIGNIQRFQPFIFSNLQTLFPAANPQPSPFHALAHSFAKRKRATPAFPVTSKLFARSLAQERKSTPVLSITCALFCRKWGWRRNSVCIFTIVTTTMTRPLSRTTASTGTFSTGSARPLALPRQPDLVSKLCQPQQSLQSMAGYGMLG